MSSTTTTSGFSTNTLEAVYSAYNNNLSYSSFTFINPSTGLQQIVPLVSFIGNPNYSGLNVDPSLLPVIYNGIISSLNNFIADVSNNVIPNYNLGTIAKFRIVVTIADGTVFFDSSKGVNNTYANFLSKSINENHGTRHYIQESFHSKSGIGYESKWSSSTQQVDTYYSVRLGQSPQGILGVLAFSYSNAY